jgi:hypothetical protein
LTSIIANLAAVEVNAIQVGAVISVGAEQQFLVTRIPAGVREIKVVRVSFVIGQLLYLDPTDRVLEGFPLRGNGFSSGHRSLHLQVSYSILLCLRHGLFCRDFTYIG